MIEEIWRPIPGYEGLYEVSSYGRVRSLDRFIVDSLGHRRFYKGKVLSPIKDKYGYLSVKLQKGNKHNIHRIVAQVFIENIDNLPQVNHKDENKSNNRVDNLEWCDQAYNNLYGTRLERLINTKIKNGYVNEENVGLSKSKKEYNQKYYQDNKNMILDKQRRYYQENTDKLKEYNQKYYQENTDKLKEYNHKYYQENKDRICEQKKEYSRKYYQDNKEKLREYFHQYYLKKKEEIQNNV